MRRNIAFITMGCAKNEVDSAAMRESLSTSGYPIVDDLSIADVIVVNTCSFIQSATEESIDAILEVLDIPSVKEGSAALIISGCLPSRYGDEIAHEFDEAFAVLTCDDEKSIVDVVGSYFDSIVEDAVPGDSISEIMDVLDESEPDGYPVMSDPNGPFDIEYAPDTVDTNLPYAYVKISDGCDRFCSYCTIPYIRGRYRSFPYATIRDSVKKHVDSGKKEIVLIAQDTGRWGTDFEEPSTLSDLLADLADQFPSVWFRVMYIQPEGVSDDLLATIRSHENICNYLDIPMQHVDRNILQSMNRKGSREEFDQLIERIVSEIPDITLRTTLIAGFPGESEDAFNELIDFVEEGYFDYVGVFPYSREDITKAAGLPDQIEDEEKLMRASKLRETADNASMVKIANRIGKDYGFLLEGEDGEGNLFGRCTCQAPETDGITFIYEEPPHEIDRVRISDTLLYDMDADLL